MNDLVPLTGEPPALDLINTRPLGADLLATHADLRAWLALQAERLPCSDDEVEAADLAAVRAVREHAASAVDHARRGERPPQADLDALNQAQRAAPAIEEVAWDGSALTTSGRRTGPPGLRVAAWLASEAACLLGDPALAQVRQCEAGDCVMLFLPAHPRRRWCSAARCGNRARVARHYQRHKPPTS